MTQATIYSVPLVGPATPTVMAQRIDDNFDAIISGHSGSSRPSYAVAGTVWEDTSVAGSVKYYHYDGSDDILLRTVDTTNNRVDQPPQPFGTVASAATTDIGAVTSENVTVTGTTTITSFGTAAAGTTRRLVFSGILTLTRNATSLILPQGGNVVTAVGDSLEAVSLGSGNWRVTSYMRVGTNGLVSGVVQAASGTAVDFTGATGIPSWAKRVTVSFYDVSTSGTTGIGLQIGPSGGPETTGYASCTSTNNLSTTQFLIAAGTVAAGVYQGMVILTRIDSNTWAFSSQLARTDTAGLVGAAGSKTLAGTLEQVRFKTGNGVETFDGGAVNILYE
ncbi:hypothetical protein [Rhizobium leguminosarum]|uniref:hypothetical protein n=1 Tax=Rhizobium leguminosarum TaxID=384 RepID=UPI001C909901|nr:hypothetical protein [Rhizobium leguminosarum]MBY2997821.1 hypothetical protein [Rhizobium leguminosarum]